MSNAVFPILPGMRWDRAKVPEFSTHVQRGVSAKEIRLAYQAYPLWTFKLAYDVLRETSDYEEVKTLQAFFCSRRGKYDSFLYADPDDSSVSNMPFGTGNGGTSFQLIRTIEGGGFTFSEPTENVTGTPIIYKDGVAVANSVAANGVVTLNSPAANGTILTWDGSYYHRVRFTEDLAEMNQFMYKLWELRTLSFVGSVVDKV